MYKSLLEVFFNLVLTYADLIFFTRPFQNCFIITVAARETQHQWFTFKPKKAHGLNYFYVPVHLTICYQVLLTTEL